jgi:hypothetical protein
VRGASLQTRPGDEPQRERDRWREERVTEGEGQVEGRESRSPIQMDISLKCCNSLTDWSFAPRGGVTINNNREASEEVRVLLNVRRGSRELRWDGSVDIKG